jgi:hypothetical protein
MVPTFLTSAIDGGAYYYLDDMDQKAYYCQKHNVFAALEHLRVDYTPYEFVSRIFYKAL